ncbi:MAG: hypothetical protein IPG21_07960 [Saprospiraceae bacterium]|nr:hypothetical protein [Candidatus Vicinibacter affinis]
MSPLRGLVRGKSFFYKDVTWLVAAGGPRGLVRGKSFFTKMLPLRGLVWGKSVFFSAPACDCLVKAPSGLGGSFLQRCYPTGLGMG